MYDFNRYWWKNICISCPFFQSLFLFSSALKHFWPLTEHQHPKNPCVVHNAEVWTLLLMHSPENYCLFFTIVNINWHVKTSRIIDQHDSLWTDKMLCQTTSSLLVPSSWDLSAGERSKGVRPMTLQILLHRWEWKKRAMPRTPATQTRLQSVDLATRGGREHGCQTGFVPRFPSPKSVPFSVWIWGSV